MKTITLRNGNTMDVSENVTDENTKDFSLIGDELRRIFGDVDIFWEINPKDYQLIIKVAKD